MLINALTCVGTDVPMPATKPQVQLTRVCSSFILLEKSMQSFSNDLANQTRKSARPAKSYRETFFLRSQASFPCIAEARLLA